MRRKEAYLVIAGDYGYHPDPQGIILEENLEGSSSGEALANLFGGEVGPELEKIVVSKDSFEFDEDRQKWVYEIREHPILELPPGERQAEVEFMKLPIIC